MVDDAYENPDPLELGGDDDNRSPQLARSPSDLSDEELRRQVEQFEIGLETEGNAALEIGLDDIQQDLDGEDPPPDYGQRLMIRYIVQDQAWPTAGMRLSYLVSMHGRKWLEDLMRRAGTNAERGLAILAVRSELIRLDLDPDRYADVDVMMIHRNLGRLQHMKNNSERSCFIQNLEVPVPEIQ